MQCGLQIQYCPKPHVESQFDISLRLGTVFFPPICCDMRGLLHRNSFPSSVKTFATVCCGITEIEKTESILQQSWNANEQRKVLVVALVSSKLGLALTNQISSKIQESDVLIVNLVCVPLVSCLHALETEHNELIDDMTKIDCPEPNVGRHPGANGHQFPPSEHPRPINYSTTNLTWPLA